MERELKRLTVVQTGKVVAILYSFIGLLTMMLTLTGVTTEARGTDRIILAIEMLILSPVVGFVAGTVTAALYNLVAKWAGGLRFTVE